MYLEKKLHVVDMFRLYFTLFVFVCVDKYYILLTTFS
jgi:hypothetical protein